MPGLPKKYAKMGFKQGWKAYKASKGKRRSSKVKSRSAPRKIRKVNPVAKRKTSRRRSFLSVSTVMKFARIGALVGPAAMTAVRSDITPMQKVNNIVSDYTGFNPTQGNWDATRLARGWLPYVATSVITHGISKLNGIIRGL